MRIPIPLLAFGMFFTASLSAQEPDPEGPPGRWVYMRHCVQCHAGKGDATGYMAPFLMPRPRDFTREPFRVVSGAQGKATEQDVFEVIYNGIPGTAMPSYKHLPESWSRNAAAFVLSLVSEDERAVQEELECPSGDRELKTEGVDVESLYQAACGICHGEEGHGDGVPAVLSTLKDSLGNPIRPRSFSSGVFKGQRDLHSLVNRIQYGMPGSPMPAFPLPPDQLYGLAEKVQSLMGQELIHPASLRAISVETLPEDPAAWEAIPKKRVPLWPMDWRHEPGIWVDVQLAHDGVDLIARMSWISPEGAEVTGAMAALDVADYLDPPYFRIHDGAGHDLCLPRTPEHMPDATRKSVRATPIQATIGTDGGVTVIQRRPLADTGIYKCDLTPDSGERWIAFRVLSHKEEGSATPEDHPEGAAFTLWSRFERD